MAARDPDATIYLHLLGSPRVVLPGDDDAGLPLGKPLAALANTHLYVRVR